MSQFLVLSLRFCGNVEIDIFIGFNDAAMEMLAMIDLLKKSVKGKVEVYLPRAGIADTLNL